MQLKSQKRPPTLRDIFDEHILLVLRTVQRLGVRPADVDDVAQEVFVVAHRKLGSYEDRGSTAAWLIAICRRVVADYRRRAHIVRERAVDDVPSEATPASQEAEVERRRLRALLEAGLSALDEDKRTIIVLFELEGLPMTEIAHIMDCPLQTAYSRLYAARKELRKVVEPQLDRGGAT